MTLSLIFPPKRELYPGNCLFVYNVHGRRIVHILINSTSILRPRYFIKKKLNILGIYEHSIEQRREKFLVWTKKPRTLQPL